MPRRRMVHPQIWRNEKFGNLTDAGRLLFIGIFSQADDDGRLKASPRFLMANIFPYDKDKTEEDIQQLRDQCADSKLIRVYANSKEEYLDIPGWSDHQQVRKDRYTPSNLPSFEEADNHPSTIVSPPDNHPSTSGDPSIVKFNVITPPKGGARSNKRDHADPEVQQIFEAIRNHFVCGGEAVPAIEESSAMTGDRRVDPIPNYGKEGQAIKRMLTRGFTSEEIMQCWRAKVQQHNGDFVSMTWVNEDIGKSGSSSSRSTRRRRPRVPDSYTPEDEF